jgi:hypothetical protein
VIITLILNFVPSAAQLNSIAQIFSTLTGFALNGISIIITQQRDSMVQATLTGENAGAASNTIYTTLVNDPNYLTSQDPSLGQVRSVGLQDNSGSGGLPLGAIIGIAIAGALVLAGVVVLIIILVKKRGGGGGARNMRDVELSANPAYQ